MLYYKSTTKGENMKVQKFNSTALVKILNQFQDSPRFGQDDSQTRAEIISARDAWISGKKTHKGSLAVNIAEKGNEVIVEVDNLTFRVAGDFVTKEQAI